MPLSNKEFEAIINDSTKRIVGDIIWREDEDRSASMEFRAEILSESGWPLFIHGSYNRLIPALSYVMILKTVGRVYGSDLGKEHHNPQCTQVGERHKHRWTERFRDKEAYHPLDITASVSDPVSVWEQFYHEAKLTHDGVMAHPPEIQDDLFI